MFCEFSYIDVMLHSVDQSITNTWNDSRYYLLRHFNHIHQRMVVISYF